MSLAAKFSQKLVGKSVLVTGGASGLGEATARYLAESGAKVTVIDMNERGAEVATAIGGKYVRADVCEESQVAEAIRIATESSQHLYGVVNCAGVVRAAKVVGRNGTVHPLKDFEQTIKVNLVGTFNVCRLAAQAMAASDISASEDRGVIVNTASIAAYEGQIGQSAYAASKGGVVSLTLPLARELAAFGIRVNTICPGVVGTPMLQNLPAPAMKALEASVPFPSRLGTPLEYAALVHHIMVNTYINGECIRLDGALRMAPK